jgi:hypothetical protein
MTIEEKVREIMLSKELPDSEKLDRLHAFIPLEVFKIDNLNKATPAQLRQERWLSNYRSNATDQTPKPFNPDKLVETILTMLKNYGRFEAGQGIDHSPIRP